MNIRLILQDDAGKRFTLPVKDVGSIDWTLDGEDSGSLICTGPHESGVAPHTLIELPASSVRTIYRDDEKAKPTSPRVPKARRAAPQAPQAAQDPE
jgi:hypothetical protein